MKTTKIMWNEVNLRSKEPNVPIGGTCILLIRKGEKTVYSAHVWKTGDKVFKLDVGMSGFYNTQLKTGDLWCYHHVEVENE